MGRTIHNQVASSSADSNILGMYFMQDDKVYGRSGQQDSSFGWVAKHTSGGTNIWGGWTGQSGYTIQESDSYLRIRFCATGDHGETWRANNFLVKMSVDNFSSRINIGGFGLTNYNGGHHNYGNSGVYERTILHNYSVGTIIKFGLEDSTNSGGHTYTYNNVNKDQDGNDGTQNTYGQVWTMNLKVEEIKASAVSAMTAQNTFATGA
mgnify:CR=1 FL=1|tara:strand:- start:1292 stop:1912 length:621 start_codon:yes stop_codon:yes gene_type:complete